MHLQNNFVRDKYGYYVVGENIHRSVMLAHIDATESKNPIKWIYHDDLFGSINRSLLGKVSLDDIYRQRAQQLRDDYDYLILNYSGGADSHNVLMTFINNNIKLDQITVRLPFSAINKKLHNPTPYDKSASNRNSEWDYNIKPFLDTLSLTHPDIRIELLDWLDSDSIGLISEDIFSDPRGGYFLGSLLRSPSLTVDKVERDLLDKGKTVGILWGIDKPRLICTGTGIGDKVYMSLKDKPMVISSPTDNNPQGTEYFYWTPDMPLLAWEMAYKSFQFFNYNQDMRKILVRSRGEDYNVSLEKWQNFCDVINNVLYTTWSPSKFQVNKPGFGSSTLDMRPGDIVIETLPILAPLREKWKYHWKDYDKFLDRSIPSVLSNGEFSAVPCKYHYVGSFSL